MRPLAMRPLAALALLSLLAAFGAAPAARAGEAAYTLDTALEDIAANPAGAAVVRKEIPGLLENSAYPMFKGMSLRLLAGLSHGRMTPRMLERTGAGLAAISAPPHARLRTVSSQAGDPDFH